MKNVVLSGIGREREFKPTVIFEKYLALASKCAKQIFRKGSMKKRACPACGAKKTKKAFKKFGFQYEECGKCATVFMLPGLKDADIKEYYLSSAAIKFWKDTLSRVTGEKRKEKIYDSRVQWILSIVDEYQPKAESIVDLNSRDMNYTVEMLNSPYFKKKFVVNPYFDMQEIIADRSIKGSFTLLPDLEVTGDIKGRCDIVSAFEVIDMTGDVGALMKRVKELLVPGGLLFMTTISISGFESQVLWGDSQSIFPPDRINVFSRKGLESLFKKYGFEIIEYSTPGLLDLDIIKSVSKRKPGIQLPRFVNTMLEYSDENMIRDFQNFLQANKLSSFARVALRKR